MGQAATASSRSSWSVCCWCWVVLWRSPTLRCTWEAARRCSLSLSRSRPGRFSLSTTYALHESLLVAHWMSSWLPTSRVIGRRAAVPLVAGLVVGADRPGGVRGATSLGRPARTGDLARSLAFWRWPFRAGDGRCGTGDRVQVVPVTTSSDGSSSAYGRCVPPRPPCWDRGRAGRSQLVVQRLFDPSLGPS